MVRESTRRQLLKFLGGLGVMGLGSGLVYSRFWNRSPDRPTDSNPQRIGAQTEMRETDQTTLNRTWPSPTKADVIIEPDQELATALTDAPSEARIWLSAGVHRLTEPGTELKPRQYLATKGGELRIEFDRSTDGRAIKVNDGAVVEGITLNGNMKEVNGLDIWGDNCVVRNCEVKNFTEGRYPINVYKADGVHVVNNHFHHNKTRGCAVSGALELDEWATNCLIASNRFEDNRTGMKLRGAKNCVVRDNLIRITDVPTMDHKRGILLQARDHPNQDNLIAQNFVQVIDNSPRTSYSPKTKYCVFLSEDRQGSDYETMQNVFRSNRLVGGDFTVYANTNANFTENLILNPSGVAVLIDANAEITFNGDFISGLIRNRGGEMHLQEIEHSGKIES